MSIFLALTVVTMLMMLAALSLRISSDEMDISSNDSAALQARYAAESGILNATVFLRSDCNYSGSLHGTLEVLVDEDPANAEIKYATYKVDVTGASASSPGEIYSSGAYNGRKIFLVSKLKSRSPLVTGKSTEAR